jgi:hypothetical protein
MIDSITSTVIGWGEPNASILKTTCIDI